MAKGKRSRQSSNARRQRAARRSSGQRTGSPATTGRPVAKPQVHPQPLSGQQAARKTAPVGGASRASAAAKTVVDFTTEYRYVLGDLKRLGIIAAAMFTTLIVLALIVR